MCTHYSFDVFVLPGYPCKLQPFNFNRISNRGCGFRRESQSWALRADQIMKIMHSWYFLSMHKGLPMQSKSNIQIFLWLLGWNKATVLVTVAPKHLDIVVQGWAHVSVCACLFTVTGFQPAGIIHPVKWWGGKCHYAEIADTQFDLQAHEVRACKCGCVIETEIGKNEGA